MELGEALTTERHLLMVSRLLCSCPRYAVTKAVLREKMDAPDKHKMSTYRVLESLIICGYVAEEKIKGRRLFRVDHKRLTEDFKDLEVVRTIFRVFETSENIIRIA